MDYPQLFSELLSWSFISSRRGCLLFLVLIPLVALDYWLWTINFPVWILVIGTVAIIVPILWSAPVKD